MATRNLARTAFEPSRSMKLKYGQRKLRRNERRKVRYELKVIATDATMIDEVVLTKRVSMPGYSNFEQHDTDKHLRRWLASHVGRPWNDVFAEVVKKFDRRTMVGRHIIDCHILCDVKPWNYLYVEFARFVIDQIGMLRIGYSN